MVVTTDRFTRLLLSELAWGNAALIFGVRFVWIWSLVRRWTNFVDWILSVSWSAHFIFLLGSHLVQFLKKNSLLFSVQFLKRWRFLVWDCWLHDDRIHSLSTIVENWCSCRLDSSLGWDRRHTATRNIAIVGPVRPYGWLIIHFPIWPVSFLYGGILVPQLLVSLWAPAYEPVYQRKGLFSNPQLRCRWIFPREGIAIFDLSPLVPSSSYLLLIHLNHQLILMIIGWSHWSFIFEIKFLLQFLTR